MGLHQIYAATAFLAVVGLHFHAGSLRSFLSTSVAHPILATPTPSGGPLVVRDPTSWHHIYDLELANRPGELDPAACRPVVWQAGGRPNSGKDEKWTFALAVTKMDAHYAAQVVASVGRLRRVSGHQVTVIVLRSGATREGLRALEAGLAPLPAASVVLADNPIDDLDLPEAYLRILESNGNCCGAAEFIKLLAVALPYDKVLLLDVEAVVLKPLDHLFACDFDLIYAAGFTSPLNAGMLLVRGNRPDRLEHMLAVLAHASRTYTQEQCFGWLGCGPCKCHWCEEAGERCGGQEGPQGFLHYFFVKRGDAGLRVARVSTCLYNYQYNGMLHCARTERTGLSPYIVHKGNDVLRKASYAGLHPKQQPTAKACRVDFWILGPRQSGGASALHARLAEHPKIHQVRVRGAPTGGGVFGSAATLAEYNSRFEGVAEGLLVGDSRVVGLEDDPADLTAACGHRHSKFLIMLQDPVESCHSELLAKARLRTGGLNMRTNLSRVIERRLSAFEAATRLTPLGAVDAGSTVAGAPGELDCMYGGVYAPNVRRWFNYTGIDNSRVYFMEDFRGRTGEVVPDALAFLGLDTEPQGRWSMPGRGQEARGGGRLPKHQALTPALRSKLQDAFAPYNRMLEDVLGVRTPWGY